MEKAYSYIRFSTSEQTKGDSLRRQIAASQKYAADHGLELDESLRDLGVSAYKGANATGGALAGFLAQIEAKTVKEGSYLLVESLDRISRQTVSKALRLFTGILEAGVKIVTLADGRLYDRDSLDDPVEIIASLLSMARAHEESAIKAQRVSAAWTNKKKQARTGMVITRKVPLWIRVIESNGKQSFELIPERVAVVRNIITQTINGRGGSYLEKWLNESNIPSWKTTGKGWERSYLVKDAA